MREELIVLLIVFAIIGLIDWFLLAAFDREERKAESEGRREDNP